jgi:hypothetical protein
MTRQLTSQQLALTEPLTDNVFVLTKESREGPRSFEIFICNVYWISFPECLNLFSMFVSTFMRTSTIHSSIPMNNNSPICNAV